MSTTGTVEARAFARVGLLGNPSDGYDGRVLAFTVADFHASVTLAPAPAVEIRGPAGTALDAAGWGALTRELAPRSLDGGEALVVAAARRLAGHDAAVDVPGFRLTWSSNVPLTSGLSGSSAIVVATLRALARWCGMRIEAIELARLALAAEREELGIGAGPQDRLVQSVEGFLDMDFSGGPDAWRFERLDPRALPPLYLAWPDAPGERSGVVHDRIRERWEAGDPEVRAAMARFARLAAEGRACLERGDVDGLRARVDANFDTRARIWTLSESDRELVATGRRAGAAVKLCGSGGSVIGVLGSPAERDAALAAHRAAGHRTLVPRIHVPAPGSTPP